MDNVIIKCPSCNSSLKKAAGNNNYDCFCPTCGQAIRVQNDECILRACDDIEDQNILIIRNEVQYCIQHNQWRDAASKSYHLHNITEDDHDWLITGECMYQWYMEEAMIYHAYLALYGILYYETTFLEEKSYYEKELKLLKMILGVTPFNDAAVYDFICEHKPQSVELADYSGRFLQAAIISSKYGRKHPEFTATDPKVIPFIKNYAKKRDFKIPIRRRYTPFNLKPLKSNNDKKQT